MNMIKIVMLDDVMKKKGPSLRRKSPTRQRH